MITSYFSLSERKENLSHQLERKSKISNRQTFIDKTIIDGFIFHILNDITCELNSDSVWSRQMNST